jgi:hypothetical protein
MYIFSIDLEIGQNWNFVTTWWPRFEIQKLQMWMGLELWARTPLKVLCVASQNSKF